MPERYLGGHDAGGVANSHDRDVVAVRDASPAAGWTDVPAASGAECARALRRAGLDVTLDGPDRMLVKRFGIPVVSIPLVDRLRGELVAAIARTAGLTAPEFIDFLRG